MKVICAKTNIAYTTSGYSNFVIRSTHPLFSASYETLLEVAKSWRRGELSEGERRVLFVALLDSTRLLDWECAATPAPDTVQKYMEYLLMTVDWIHATGKRIPLNRIAINSSTCTLESKHHYDSDGVEKTAYAGIRVWLNNWNNTQREFTMSSHMQSVRDKIAKSQDKLLRLIRNEREDSDSYARGLATWFLQASNAPKALHTYWTELFLLKRPAVWNASCTDLDELVEHFQDNVPLVSPYAMAAYRHIVAIRRDCKEGILSAITGTVTGNGAANYTIIQEQTEIDNIAAAVAQAGESAPIEREFSSKTQYLVEHIVAPMKPNFTSVKMLLIAMCGILQKKNKVNLYLTFYFAAMKQLLLTVYTQMKVITIKTKSTLPIKIVVFTLMK